MVRNAESRGIRFGGSPVGVILSRETVALMFSCTHVPMYPRRASRGSLQALTAPAVMSIHRVKVFTVPAGLMIGERKEDGYRRDQDHREYHATIKP